MRRIKLIISYDGTNYHGWQIQQNAITIEEILNRELSKLLGETILVIGASRTDSGVHAFGNVAVFDTVGRFPADKISHALNQRLPDDIVIQKSYEVSLEFHPRRCNSQKTYEYQILNRSFRIPSCRFHSYFYYVKLNVENMKKGAEYLLGEHDFKSFCSSRTHMEDTVRTIYRLDLHQEEDMITIRITGDGFLYNMVRIIVGSLIKVGSGGFIPEDIRDILNKRDRAYAGPKAPALGLTLVGIEYEQQSPEYIEAENKFWSYQMMQQNKLEGQNTYIEIRYCTEMDFETVVIRLCKKAFRNGADRVYICDSEKGRFFEGQLLDSYRMKEIDVVEVPERYHVLEKYPWLEVKDEYL